MLAILKLIFTFCDVFIAILDIFLLI